ncbi:cysteine hydrolase family protein [Nioella aestuarii]|uniref:cysteine hydrolase family protein n=1 Tax=Nioella aestuarii TaxID=1662864 RepID=UPI003D7FEF5A
MLIDLQSVFWEDGPYSESDRRAAQAAILMEIDAAKAAGTPVIAIRQEWSIPSTKLIARLAMKGQAVAGTPGTGLAAPFADIADHSIIKRVQDAFETGELDQVLNSLDVGRLRLVGLDFNYCVLKTALAARNRGYEVTVVGPGTLAAASTEKAQALLAEKGVIVV